jgi:hypothetical protein
MPIRKPGNENGRARLDLTCVSPYTLCYLWRPLQHPPLIRTTDTARVLASAVQNREYFFRIGPEYARAPSGMELDDCPTAIFDQTDVHDERRRPGNLSSTEEPITERLHMGRRLGR